MLSKPVEGTKIYRFENGFMKMYVLKSWKGNRAYMSDGSVMVWSSEYGFSLRKMGELPKMPNNSMGYELGYT